MQKIEAIIQPGRLEAVKNALSDFEVSFVTVTRVRGFGRQKGHREVFPGSEYTAEFSSKLKVELVLNDADVPAASRLIVEQAKTGRIGDGKIFIFPVDETFRIRNGDIGETAV